MSEARARQPQTRPKMVDVGRLAGVSAQTVSRFYTGKGYVSADTRQRIESAIAELNYQINGSARSLRVNATRTVGVLSRRAWPNADSAAVDSYEAALLATRHLIELGRIGFRMLTERITTGERVPRQVIHPNLVTRQSSARIASD